MSSYLSKPIFPVTLKFRLHREKKDSEIDRVPAVIAGRWGGPKGDDSKKIVGLFQNIFYTPWCTHAYMPNKRRESRAGVMDDRSLKTRDVTRL